MKKTLVITTIIIILATTLCGCISSKASVENNSNTNIEEIDIAQFKEVISSSENINFYRKEVVSRIEALKEDESFISNDDWKVISNSQWLTDSKNKNNTYFTIFDKTWESVSKYYYPVVFREGNSLILWYTAENGTLLFEKLYGYEDIGGNYGGQVHHNTSDEEILSSKTDYTVTYDQKTGEVKLWKFGIVEETYTGIPKESVYCGFSFFEGYIFRTGTDVYSLNAVDTYITDGVVKCIAHNVKYVIDADYYYGSDPWCQPLFQMTDGSIKCYVSWEGDENAAPDDISYLCDLQYEGSWDK